MSTVYFGIGSNLGDRLQNLREAVDKLKALGKIESISNIYETKAWGGVPQPDYLNACVKAKLHDEITAPEILRIVKNFEYELGRVESVRWGARKIDIDILLIDDEIYHSSELDIPHMRIPERLFVLVPLRDILPTEWKHPVNGKSVNEMIAALEGEDMPVMVGEL